MEKSSTADSFLCGGNAEDPLNLEGLSQFTKSTKRAKKSRFSLNKDPVIIPSILNVKNPLNLMLDIDNLNAQETILNKSLKLENDNLNVKLSTDPIVSPVININQRHILQKRRRNSSESSLNGCSNKHVKELHDSNKPNEPKASMPKNNTNFLYGNYPTYYNYRNINKKYNDYIDPRINIIDKKWIEGKNVLDIGCNVGYVTKYIAKAYKPLRITGIDIDDNLIKRARYNVLKDLDSNRSVKKPPSFVHSLSKMHLYPPYSVDNLKLFPYNLEFITANYVCECQELLDMQSPEYNIILCLSVSKWIHLNWGDEGLKRTFLRIYSQLCDNGLFIFEPQEWTSYKKAKKKNKQKIGQLTFRPQYFKSYLLNDIGFSYVKAFYPEKSSPSGFDRTLYVYLKCQMDKVENTVKDLHLEGGEYKSKITSAHNV